MSQYTTGTITVSNGSNVITGSGTSWLSEISIGDLLSVSGEPPYWVSLVNSNTSITLTGPWGGASSSGLSYAITRDFASNGNPLINPNDTETAQAFNIVAAQSLNANVTGDAVNYDVQASPTDSTPNRVMLTGAGGLLGAGGFQTELDANNYPFGTIGLITPRFVDMSNVPSDISSLSRRGAISTTGDTVYAEQTLTMVNVDQNSTPRRFIRFLYGGTYTSWQEIYTTANLNVSEFFGSGYIGRGTANTTNNLRVQLHTNSYTKATGIIDTGVYAPRNAAWTSAGSVTGVTLNGSSTGGFTIIDCAGSGFVIGDEYVLFATSGGVEVEF